MALAFPAALETFQEADEVLGFHLSHLAWEGPEAELTQTKNAQPALLVHSVAVHRVIGEELEPISLAAGHSLGEFSAHVAAGTLSFEDALRAVRIRGELMFESGIRRPGTMAAILGLSDEDVESVCRSVTSQGGVCVPANFNSPGQVVVSGDVAGVELAMARAKEAGAKKTIPLTVSGAFHSPLMAPAQEGLRETLSGLKFSDPAFPVISNVMAEPVTSGSEARELLVRQLTSPVRWSGSIQRMVALGAERFVEMGPGSVLSGLNKRNARGIESVSLGTPEDLERLAG